MTTASVLLEVRSTAIARWETIIYRATISEWGEIASQWDGLAGKRCSFCRFFQVEGEPFNKCCQLCPLFGGGDHVCAVPFDAMSQMVGDKFYQGETGEVVIDHKEDFLARAKEMLEMIKAVPVDNTNGDPS